MFRSGILQLELAEGSQTENLCQWLEEQLLHQFPETSSQTERSYLITFCIVHSEVAWVRPNFRGIHSYVLLCHCCLLTLPPSPSSPNTDPVKYSTVHHYLVEFISYNSDTIVNLPDLQRNICQLLPKLYYTPLCSHGFVIFQSDLNLSKIKKALSIQAVTEMRGCHKSYY